MTNLTVLSPMQVSEYDIRRKAHEIWRNNPYVSRANGDASPFDEPAMYALVRAITEAVNSSLTMLTVAPPIVDNEHLAHLCCFDAVRGWVPVCQLKGEQAARPAPTCIECSSHP